MSYVLDVETTDQYQYLTCPGTSRVTVQVFNAIAAIGFGQITNPGLAFRAGSGTYPPNDEPIAPSAGGLARDCDEIRVKSYAAGTPANVKIVAHET